MRHAICLCALIFIGAPLWAAGNYCVDRATGNWSSPATWTCYPMVNVTLTNPGSGGPANGTYNLTISGGTCTTTPAGKYTVTGGAVTSVWLTSNHQAPWYGRCTAAPSTVTFASGPANATATLALAGSAAAVPGDGDFVGIQSHTVTIDQNIGTSAGGGVARIESWRTSGSGGTLAVDCTAPRSIIFGSTGTSAYGSGSVPYPGSDATMFGITGNSGTVNLACSNPPAYLAVSSVTYGNPTAVTVSSTAPATDAGVTVFSPSCPALDGLVALATNTGGSTFTIPADSSACSTAFGTNPEDSITVNPITMTAANPSYPVYLSTNSNYLGSAAGNDIAIDTNYLAIHNLGHSQGVNGPYDGIVHTVGTVHIAHTYADGGYMFAEEYYSNGLTISTSLVGGGFTASNLIGWNLAAGSTSDVSVSDVVELPATVGSDLRTLLSSSYFDGTFTAQRIVTYMADQTHRMAAVLSPAIAGTVPAPAINITDVLCASPGDAGTNTFVLGCVTAYAPPSTGGSTTLTGIMADGPSRVALLKGLANSTTQGTATSFWTAAKQLTGAVGAQGDLVYGSGYWAVSHGVMTIDACANHMCENAFGWQQSGGPTTQVTLDHMTFDGGPEAQWNWQAWENSPNFTGALRSSIGYINNPFAYRCLLDNLNSGAGTSYVQDTLDTGVTVGVHHNATFCSGGAAYATTYKYPYWQSGSTAHPNAIYHDIDGVNPGFAKPARRLATADKDLFGGPGTMDHLIREMAKISGFGGPYVLSTNGQLPLANIRQYLMAGYTPQNPQFWCSGWDGDSIGAVSFCGKGKVMLAAVAF